MDPSSFAAFPDDDCLDTFDCPVRGDNDSPAFLFDAISEKQIVKKKNRFRANATEFFQTVLHQGDHHSVHSSRSVASFNVLVALSEATLDL